MMSQPARNTGVLASLAGIVAVCATLSVPAPAWAAYDAKSTDENILKSCTDFRTDSAGVMSANCNEWDDGKVQSVKARTIDLDEKIGLKDGKLEYGQSNFSGVCKDETVSWSSSKVVLAAACEGKIVGIRLDDRITNVGYGGTGGDPGLYWSDAAGGSAGENAPLEDGS